MRGVIEYDRTEREKKAKSEATPDVEVDQEIVSAIEDAPAVENQIPTASPRPGHASKAKESQPMIDSDGEEY